MGPDRLGKGKSHFLPVNEGKSDIVHLLPEGIAPTESDVNMWNDVIGKLVRNQMTGTPIGIATDTNHQDENTMQDYIRHSLPRELSDGKNIGQWHKQLAKIANGSLLVVITEFMNYLAEDFGSLIVIDSVSNTINLAPEAQTELDRIIDIGKRTLPN